MSFGRHCVPVWKGSRTELFRRYRQPAFRVAFRLRLRDDLTSLIEASSELAAELGIPRTRLHYHVNVLEKHGIIRVASTRVVNGATERRYEPTGRMLQNEICVRVVPDFQADAAHRFIRQSAMQENSRPDTLVFEARAGGEVYEQRGEERHHWGFVTVWEPPHRFVLDWKVNPDWTAPTEVEITFTPEGGGTRVDLEHRGWERLTEGAPEFRASYNDGWVPVLDRFGQAANA